MTLKLSAKKIKDRLMAIFIFILFFSIFIAFVIPPFDGEVECIIITFVAGILPNIILLIEHLTYTVKIEAVEFSTHDFKVLFKNGTIEQFDYDDIKVIQLYRSAGMDKGNYSYSSNERYYFANIIAKDGRKIILTSLLGPDLDDALSMMKDVPVDKTKTAYAFVFWYVD